jgi:transcriptional regulator with XRE-family HTH domain
MAYSQTLKDQIGARVRFRRKRLKISAQKLAERANLHRNTVSRIEWGEHASIDSLWHICKVLGISLDSLCEGWDGEKLLSSPNRGSDVLYPVRIGLGSQRSQSAGMPTQTSAAAGSSSGGFDGSRRKEVQKEVPATVPYSRARLA